MASSFFWTTGGLVATLIGVVLLFRYGMPYRVRTGGASHLLLEETDHQAQAEEKRFSVLGWIGLTLIIAGAAAQIYGAFLAAS